MAKERPIVEYDITFTDLTMVETDGNYAEVKALFDTDLIASNWNVSTWANILSPMGEGRLFLNFRQTKHVFIIEYFGSNPDPYQNADIGFLTRWCQESGWYIPSPSSDLIDANPDFWKHMWQTGLIDSVEMTARFGPRAYLPSQEELEYEEAEKKDDSVT